MNEISADLQARLQPVRCLLTDVDGVLTDGGLHYGSGGQEFKTFNVLDGHGLTLARQAGLLVGVLSARPSEATRQRAADLRLPIVKIGPTDKGQMLAEVQREHELAAAEIAFIGDDLVDLPVLRRVGFAATVPNAVEEVKAAVHYTTRRPGGHGAVREVIELILKARGLWQQAIARYMVLLSVLLLATAAAFGLETGSGFIEKFEVPERDAAGNLLWKLTGDRAQFGTNGLLTVLNARAEYYSSNQLAGVFITPVCLLDRANSRATTDAAVRIEREGLVVTGIGGVWDGKSSTITIHSNVQMVIPTQSPKALPFLKP